MIRKLQIAPGPWDAAGRKAAKVAAFVAGVLFVWWGSRMGMGLIDAVEAGQPITMWSALLPLVPITIGGAGIFPGVLTPIIYRAIDKWGKGSE